MKCFNHHDRDAFGVCKVCGKGLCLECMQKTACAVICKKDLKCKLGFYSHCLVKVLLTILLIYIFIAVIASYLYTMPLK